MNKLKLYLFKEAKRTPECCCSTVHRKRKQTLWLIHQMQNQALNEYKLRTLPHRHSAKLTTKHIKTSLHVMVLFTTDFKQTLKKVSQRKSRGRSRWTRKRKATFRGPLNWSSWMKAWDLRDVKNDGGSLDWEWNTLRKANRHRKILTMMMRPDTNLKSWRMGDEALFFVMVSFVLTIFSQVPLCICARERERESWRNRSQLRCLKVLVDWRVN